MVFCCWVIYYLPKRSTEICRAQCGNAMLVSLVGAQTWPPEINENIWNSLLLFQRLLFSHELLYNHINFSPNALLSKLLKITRRVLFRTGESFVTDAVLVSRRVKSQKFNILYFQNERRYRAKNLWRYIFLSHLQPGGDIKSEDLAIYDFRILWRHMKTSN